MVRDERSRRGQVSQRRVLNCIQECCISIDSLFHYLEHHVFRISNNIMRALKTPAATRPQRDSTCLALIQRPVLGTNSYLHRIDKMTSELEKKHKNTTNISELAVPRRSFRCIYRTTRCNVFVLLV